jgi:hypothetical protein
MLSQNEDAHPRDEFYKRECQENVCFQRRRGEAALDIQLLSPGCMSLAGLARAAEDVVLECMFPVRGNHFVVLKRQQAVRAHECKEHLGNSF